MKQFFVAALTAVVVLRTGSWVQADDNKDANPVIDKAVKALGGDAKLKGDKALSWKGKGKLTIQGNDTDITTSTTVKGLDHYRHEFEGEFQGNAVQIITVLAGDKGWFKFRDEVRDLSGEPLANQKQPAYLQVVAATVLPLKDKAFKIKSVSEEKVGDKPAMAIKAEGPDKKEFQLFFDKETGLPVKLTAKVIGFGNEEYDQETHYQKYTDVDGVKRATKIEMKRNGETFLTQELSDFKTIDKPEPSTFKAP